MANASGKPATRRNRSSFSSGGTAEGDVGSIYSRPLPNGKLLLEGLALTQERLLTGSKVAVPVPVLRRLLLAAVAALPFDEHFYLLTYQDIHDACKSGKILDPRLHYIETGYFEGRLGVMPDIDDEFYRQTYPDVADALASGKVKSVRDHYLESGAYEGRFANARDADASMPWMKVLGGMT